MVKLEKVAVATGEEDEDALFNLEIAELNTKNNPHSGEIVEVDATAGRLIIWRNDGSVCCFQLGMLDPTAPGFAYELRDDGGFGQLWGIMSRINMQLVENSSRKICSASRFSEDKARFFFQQLISSVSYFHGMVVELPCFILKNL